MADVKMVIAEAADKANGIAQSAIVAARVAEIAPEAFAKAWFEKEKNDEYRAKVASAMVAEELAFRKAEEAKLK